MGLATYPTLCTHYISSKLDIKGNASINISMAISRIVLSSVLVPLYGIEGAILSIFITRVVMIIVSQYIIRTQYL